MTRKRKLISHIQWQGRESSLDTSNGKEVKAHESVTRKGSAVRESNIKLSSRWQGSKSSAVGDKEEKAQQSMIRKKKLSSQWQGRKSSAVNDKEEKAQQSVTRKKISAVSDKEENAQKSVTRKKKLRKKGKRKKKLSSQGKGEKAQKSTRKNSAWKLTESASFLKCPTSKQE